MTGVVPIVIFAFFMAGSFVWLDYSGQEENWDLANQNQTEAEKAARLEELCQEDRLQKDIPCLTSCSGSGAFGLSCTKDCGLQEYFKEICEKSFPKSGQEELRPWDLDLADQIEETARKEYIRPWDFRGKIEETARLENLCRENSPYCFRRCDGSGAFGSACSWPCGRNCGRPSKPNNLQKSSENQLSWDTIWPEIWLFIVVFLMSLQFYPFVLLCWLLTLSARFSSMDGLALCIGSPRAFPVLEFEDQGYPKLHKLQFA